MPAIAQVVAEETPRMFVVFVGHQDAHSSSVDVGAGGHVLFPDDTKKERAGARHDGDVRKSPIPIIFFERFDHVEEKRVPRYGAHGVVGDPCRVGLSRPATV